MRLIAVVAVVGMIATSSALAADSALTKAVKAGGHVMTSSELKKVFFGATHYWEARTKRNPSKGIDYVDKKGVDYIVRSVGKPKKDVAKLEVVGDALCFHLDNMTGDPKCEYLQVVVKTKSAYVMFDKNTGNYTIDILKFAKGDPEHLGPH